MWLINKIERVDIQWIQAQALFCFLLKTDLEYGHLIKVDMEQARKLA